MRFFYEENFYDLYRKDISDVCIELTEEIFSSVNDLSEYEETEFTLALKPHLFPLFNKNAKIKSLTLFITLEGSGEMVAENEDMIEIVSVHISLQELDMLKRRFLS